MTENPAPISPRPADGHLTHSLTALTDSSFVVHAT